MRRRFAFFLLVFILFQTDTIFAEERIYFYLDGQEQRYEGDVAEVDGELFIPLRPLLLHLQYVNENWEVTSTDVRDFIRKWYIAKEEKRKMESDLFDKIDVLSGVTIELINNRPMISIGDAKKLGFDAYFYENEKILHVNTPKLDELAGLTIGDQMKIVEERYPDVHWNTAFGQQADYNGFIGEMLPYSYTDRYGYERKGEIPELQVEIKDGKVSYLFVSSDRFETSKRMKVGDRLSEVIRAYGSQFVRDHVDGKEIVVYDVEFGSIWFIANKERIVERIAYWDHHLQGFGKMREEIHP